MRNLVYVPLNLKIIIEPRETPQMINRLSTSTLLLALATHCVGYVYSAEYILEGQGVLADLSPPFGVTGEGVTITINLNTDDFAFVPVANPVFHLFEPTTTVPIQVVGDVSGVFPDIDPVQRLAALELTDQLGVNDQIGIDNGTPSSVTSVVRFLCTQPSCFDGDLGPFTPPEAFLLLQDAVQDPMNWDPSTSIGVFTGGASEIIGMNNFSWSITLIPEPTSLSLAMVGSLVFAGVALRRRLRR